MTDYEIIGRITAGLGATALLLGFLALILKGAWFVLQEVLGWHRIRRAVRLLYRLEEGEIEVKEIK